MDRLAAGQVQRRLRQQPVPRTAAVLQLALLEQACAGRGFTQRRDAALIAVLRASGIRHRAHYFFARARWDADALGLAVARLVVELLVPAGDPVSVAVDDTLFRRRGNKVWAASWFHDGSAQGPARTGYGNNWVVLAVIVSLPVVSRPVAVPVMAKLVIKGTNSKSRLWLASWMAGRPAAALPGAHIRVVADSACAGGELKALPPGVSWTTRLRKDAALHDLPPERTGRRGRPRLKGDRLPSLARLATAVRVQVLDELRAGLAERAARCCGMRWE